MTAAIWARKQATDPPRREMQPDEVASFLSARARKAA